MHVEDVLAIAVQEPDALLISKKTKRPLRKVEQRADAGVGLAIVVAERAFVIAAQLRYTVIGGKCPAVAEGLVHFELHGFVFTLGVLVGVWLAIAVELSSEGSAITGLAKRNLALLQAGAVRKQLSAGINPSVRVDRRETPASGDWARGIRASIEAIALIGSDVGCWVIVAVNAGRWQPQRFHCTRI